jgi:outer membrane lipopolysaccharide assembly protein LptE/RlpB
MKDQLANAKKEMLEALRRAEREKATKQVIRKLEKLIADIESFQATIK